MKRFWIIFIVLVVVIGAGFGALWRFTRGLEQGLEVKGGLLVWNVAGDYPEERDQSFWGQVRSRGGMTLSELVFALDRAGEDDRITGLALDVRSLDADWAKVEEMREAVARFRASGKPVTAYVDGAGTREYALAAAADRIVMSPEANLMVLGISAELVFLKDTLGKLGMNADFVHVGAYKSAPERMTRSSASDPNREMVTAIVEDRYRALLDMIAGSRGRERSEAAAWIDRGMFDAESALASGLVDTLGYWDDLAEDLEAGGETTDLGTYSLERRGSRHTARKVALVYVTGVIMPGESRWDRFQGKLAGSTTVVDQLRSVGEDEDVDAVILRVDSPGGSALASDLIWHAVEEVRESKPVIVSMSGLAASGGYYVSCHGDSIFADPGTLTGSIGVFAGKMDRSGMYRKIGVNREFITRGENALLFSDEGGFTDGQRELFQDQLDRFYERFLAKVGEGRRMDRDAVHAVARGRVWTGAQGEANGLVDGLGGLRRALTSAKWMLGLDPADKVTVTTFGEELTFMERLLLKSFREGGGFGRLALRLAGEPAGAPAPELHLAGVLLDALRRDGTLAAVELLDGRPVALMPCWIRVR